MTDYLNYWSKDAVEAPHVLETWETDGPTKKEIDWDLYKRKAQGKKKDRSKDKKKPKKYKPQVGLEFDDDISVLFEEQAFVDMPEILAFEKFYELSVF